MNTDPWFLLLVLSLAAYRLTRLVVKDDFPPVLWVRDKLAGGWREPTTKERYHENYPEGQIEEGSLTNVPGLGMFGLVDGEIEKHVTKASWSPFWLGDLVSCPWCASAYVSAALVSASAGADWVQWSFSPLLWLAVWGTSSLVASKEWA